MDFYLITSSRPFAHGQITWLRESKVLFGLQRLAPVLLAFDNGFAVLRIGLSLLLVSLGAK